MREHSKNAQKWNTKIADNKCHPKKLTDQKA